MNFSNKNMCLNAGRSEALRLAVSHLDVYAVSNWLDLVDMMPLPGEALSVLARRGLRAFDLLSAFVRCGTVERAIVSTFNFGADALVALDVMMEKGDIGMLDVVYNRGADSGAIGGAGTADLRALPNAYPGRVRLGTEDVHAKVIGAWLPGAAYVAVGSGNFSVNHNLETYVIFNSPEMFMFHARWIGEVCRHGR